MVGGESWLKEDVMPGYDAQPYKVRPCPLHMDDCQPDLPRVLQSELPDPGVALDPNVDHWHVVPRGGGDNRGARDLAHWRTIALSTVRCEHGRLQGDRCLSCPDGWSPSCEGKRIGTTVHGVPVTAPGRDDHSIPKNWLRKED